jgi:cytochrome c oxidase subunit II
MTTRSITWLRATILALLCAVVLPAVEPSATVGQPASVPAVTAPADIDHLVATFNPDLFALEADRHTPVTKIANMFTSPASDIGREVQYNTWFNILVYAPFLILPQFLLLYVIFKFKDRKDGRKSATFMGNHTLEIVWTAIPCLALVVVSVPVWGVLWKMELPPAKAKDAVNIEVRGKSFAWDYKYQNEDLGFAIGQDVTGFQEPLVLEKGRTTVLNITSNDVNHAWWIPAFGVKKDAIIGRYTNTWFTPDTEGLFKGQCAELCGQGHGVMVISAVVVDHARFADYAVVQRHRNDTLKVWNALQPSVEKVEPKAVDEAVAAYLTKGATPQRQLALRYWIASNYVSASRRHQANLSPEQVLAEGHDRRALVDDAIARTLAATKNP